MRFCRQGHPDEADRLDPRHLQLRLYLVWALRQGNPALPAYRGPLSAPAVLSDMDAELEALEAKLSKARAVKLGMMQELLTGKIRLI
jgi:hypothetical protein